VPEIVRSVAIDRFVGLLHIRLISLAFSLSVSLGRLFSPHELQEQNLFILFVIITIFFNSTRFVSVLVVFVVLLFFGMQK